MKLKIVLSLLFAVISPSSFSENVYATNTRITYVNAYHDYGNGDVTFKVASPHPSCSDGYWLNKDNNPGYSATLALIVSSFHAKSNMHVYGDATKLWPGSSGKYCKLYSIELG